MDGPLAKAAPVKWPVKLDDPNEAQYAGSSAANLKLPAQQKELLLGVDESTGFGVWSWERAGSERVMLVGGMSHCSRQVLEGFL